MNAALAIDALGTPGLQRIVVTGAQGFVGRALCAELGAQGIAVTVLTRNGGEIAGASRVCAIGDFTAIDDWRPLLADSDALVHLAALTHDGTRGADAARFHAVNVEVSRRLGEAAVACGIRRFVYLSSIKVNGESSARAQGVIHAFSGADTPAPEDDYGRSKLAAEQALIGLWPPAAGALTMLRPPLVYGPGQKGNLTRLMALVARQLPLPFAAVSNRRSLIYVDNLVAAIVRALGIATPGVRCYTLADVDVSTAQLLAALARGLGVPAHLIQVPAVLLGALTHVPVMGASLRRLCGSLLVDASAIREDLGWSPRVAFDEAIALTCAAWRQEQG
jgi:nucleoside-diphosphate-sugar epimerase